MIYTTVESPAYSRADHSAIDCFVTFASVGRVPFTATADDVETHSVEIFNRAVAGDFGTIRAYLAPTASVPTSISPLQARKALRAAGLKSAVDSYLASQPEYIQEEWEYATEVLRTNPTLVAAAVVLGLGDDALDQLFISARNFV